MAGTEAWQAIDWTIAIAFGVALLASLAGALSALLVSQNQLAARAGFLAAALVAVAWLAVARRDASLESELASARESIENLSAEPDGREIGPEDRKLLVGVLQSFVGRTASVVVNASDPETSAYAREIVGVLKDAGWQVPPSYGTMFTPIILPGHDSVSPGVVLGFSPEVPAGQSSEILQAFREGGVDAGIGPHFPGSDHPITILVGPAK